LYGFDTTHGETATISNAWTAMHDVLMDSPEADTYRKLRFGVKGFSEPSRHDFGHGVACACWSCVESRAIVHANIMKAKFSINSSADCHESSEFPPRRHGLSGGDEDGGLVRLGLRKNAPDPRPRDPGDG
jgi:hypothetical protein